jgi:CIC family chloride channel protein
MHQKLRVLDYTLSLQHTKRDGRLRLRTLPSKYITTLATVGSGTPSGIVSPSAVLGNSIASCLGYITNIDPDLQKTLSLCGISAALSTLLHTPFGAALFAVEVVYGNYILYKRVVFIVEAKTAFQ